MVLQGEPPLSGSESKQLSPASGTLGVQKGATVRGRRFYNHIF